MNLLMDSASYEGSVKVLTEASATGEKKYYVQGPFAQAEKQNRNGRIYPRNVLEKAIGEYLPMIEAKRSIGELNHPPHPNVNPERASHLIEALTWDGDNVLGKAKILTSLPMGKIVKGLIDEGVSFGASTRGMGSISERSGVKYVQDDFVLNTIDLVSDPSGIDCWVDGIMENRQWILDAASGKWHLAEIAKKQIQKTSASRLAEEKAALFAKFLQSIK